MGTVAAERRWFVEERAESLAGVYLTDNPNLIVTRQQGANSTGVCDVLVQIPYQGHATGRVFGVEVSALLEKESLETNNVSRRWALRRGQQERLRDVPFPICLFVFEVDTDHGGWGWVRQPSGQSLLFHRQVALSPLTPESVDNIVDAVNEWYERRASP